MAGRQVQCKTCLAMTTVPDGVEPGSLTWCRCCTADHDHGQAAAACPGNGEAGHPGAACPHPNPAVCTVVSVPVGEGADSPPPGAPGVRAVGEPCPGGHCGPGVEGCTVCRPVMHFAVTGSLS